MIGVRLADHSIREFWPEEIKARKWGTVLGRGLWKLRESFARNSTPPFGGRIAHESAGFRTAAKALTLPAEHELRWPGLSSESLDDTVDESPEEKWNKEIARRIEELDSGKVKPIPWAKARRQITALLHGR
jgi:hypothetical protein